MPCVIRFLSLIECRLYRSNQPNVFVNDNAESENILLGLSFVEFADAELDVREAVERPREGRRELYCSKVAQRG